MSVLVVGSMAYDTIETPFGKVENALGGSASYFSLAASLFTDVKVVAIVGDDFRPDHMRLFVDKGIDVRGVEKVPGETFRWHGRYGYDLGNPETLATHLNVFESFDPRLPDEYREIDYVFLANIDPDIQLRVLEQIDSPRVVACDTMSYWISKKPERLREVLSRVDVLLVNESEARELAGEASIIKAARKVLSMGPGVLVVKRGEYGALMFSAEGIFWAPCYPLEEVVDPTGAGDSFAGGFMGNLVSGDSDGLALYKRSVIYGSVVASFTVERFGLEGIANLDKRKVSARLATFMNLTKLD